MNTTEVISQMLKENTGTHFLDSGEELNRHWQKNQLRDFMSEPAARLSFSLHRNQLNIEFTRSLYHYLLERLSYNAELTKSFRDFMKDKDDCDFVGMEDFCRFYEFNFGTENTYNHESNLDQVLQYTAFGRSPDLFDHVLLQIHGGCDVRGGYTSAVAFDLKGEIGLYDSAYGLIRCPHCKTYWQTDDNYHWYREGACGLGAKTQLERYNAESGSEGKEGILVVTEDGNAFCPACGLGILKAE